MRTGWSTYRYPRRHHRNQGDLKNAEKLHVLQCWAGQGVVLLCIPRDGGAGFGRLPTTLCRLPEDNMLTVDARLRPVLCNRRVWLVYPRKYTQETG